MEKFNYNTTQLLNNVNDPFFKYELILLKELLEKQFYSYESFKSKQLKTTIKDIKDVLDNKSLNTLTKKIHSLFLNPYEYSDTIIHDLNIKRSIQYNLIKEIIKTKDNFYFNEIYNIINQNKLIHLFNPLIKEIFDDIKSNKSQFDLLVKSYEEYYNKKNQNISLFQDFVNKKYAEDIIDTLLKNSSNKQNNLDNLVNNFFIDDFFKNEIIKQIDLRISKNKEYIDKFSGYDPIQEQKEDLIKQENHELFKIKTFLISKFENQPKINHKKTIKLN